MSGYPIPAATALHIREERDALLDRALYLGGIVEAACVELGLHHDVTAAEVVAAIRALRPAQRVWLPGDTVPAGAWALNRFGKVKGPCGGHTVQSHPLVEVSVPDFAAAVAAEQARRAATDGEESA